MQPTQAVHKAIELKFANWLSNEDLKTVGDGLIATHNLQEELNFYTNLCYMGEKSQETRHPQQLKYFLEKHADADKTTVMMINVGDFNVNQNSGNHWIFAMVLITNAGRSGCLIDPLKDSGAGEGSGYSKLCEQVKKVLANFYKIEENSLISLNGSQKDNWSCGLWALAYLDYVVTHWDLIHAPSAQPLPLFFQTMFAQKNMESQKSHINMMQKKYAKIFSDHNNGSAVDAKTKNEPPAIPTSSEGEIALGSANGIPLPGALHFRPYESKDQANAVKWLGRGKTSINLLEPLLLSLVTVAINAIAIYEFIASFNQTSDTHCSEEHLSLYEEHSSPSQDLSTASLETTFSTAPNNSADSPGSVWVPFLNGVLNFILAVLSTYPILFYIYFKQREQEVTAEQQYQTTKQWIDFEKNTHDAFKDNYPEPLKTNLFDSINALEAEIDPYHKQTEHHHSIRNKFLYSVSTLYPVLTFLGLAASAFNPIVSRSLIITGATINVFPIILRTIFRVKDAHDIRKVNQALASAYKLLLANNRDCLFALLSALAKDPKYGHFINHGSKTLDDPKNDWILEEPLSEAFKLELLEFRATMGELCQKIYQNAQKGEHPEQLLQMQDYIHLLISQYETLYHTIVYAQNNMPKAYQSLIPENFENNVLGLGYFKTRLENAKQQQRLIQLDSHDLKLIHASYRDTENKLKYLFKKIKSREEVIVNQEHQQKQLAKIVQTLTEENKHLNNENAEKKETIKELRGKNEKLENENSSQTKTIHEQETEIKQLKNENSDKNKIIGELGGKNEKLENENSSQKKTIIKQNNEIKQLKNEKSSQTKTIHEQETEIKQLRQQEKTYEDTLVFLQEEIKNLEKQITTARYYTYVNDASGKASEVSPQPDIVSEDSSPPDTASKTFSSPNQTASLLHHSIFGKEKKETSYREVSSEEINSDEPGLKPPNPSSA